MCLNPITIVNRTKYISLKYQDRFLVQVPCGHCVECQKQKSNEWYYRTYIQCSDTIRRGGYVYFDTLTYNNQSLPHISDYLHLDDAANNFPCFNSQHLRLFFAKLRQRMKRRYNANFTYFAASEYGTSERHTHRPHYHVLFFVDGAIDSLQFSQEVANCWNYGRTDGLPYKSRAYVKKNTFGIDDFASSLRCCRYVSKYVQKNCMFQTQINKRLDAIMRDIGKHFDVDWLESEHAKLVRQKIKRHINQFHRQSTQFGASALADLDLLSLYRTGSLYMPDSNQVKIPIGLPTYYKRKLFYELIEVDGSRLWIPTDDGKKYLAIRKQQTLKRLEDRLEVYKLQYKFNYNSSELADYVLNKRGRFIADHPESDVEERLQNITHYNYITPTDKQHIGVGVTSQWCGNSYTGYKSSMPPHYTPYFFSQRFCFFDEAKEKNLQDVYNALMKLNESRQDAYEIRQRVVNLLHACS